MKKFIVILAAMFCSLSIMAQNDYDWQSQRHFFSASIGTPSMQGVIDFDYGNGTSIGSYTLQYGYNAIKWMRVGASVNYEGFASKIQTYHRAVFLARVDFTYLNRQFVKLYSGVGMGIQYASVGDFPVRYAYNITPIGIHAGSDRIFALAELNLGATDFMRVGFGVHF